MKEIVKFLSFFDNDKLFIVNKPLISSLFFLIFVIFWVFAINTLNSLIIFSSFDDKGSLWQEVFLRDP